MPVKRINKTPVDGEKGGGEGGKKEETKIKDKIFNIEDLPQSSKAS
jgi:hypothetical protein